MGNSFQSPNENSIPSSGRSKKTFWKSLVASGPKSSSHLYLKQIASLGVGKGRKEAVSNAALFLLKVCALETVRRFSKAKCPYVWSGLQGLQVICYPPFKWLQRWDPFRSLVKGMQILSNPLLVLSVGSAFYDHSECSTTLEGNEDSHRLSDTHVVPELEHELPFVQSNPDASFPIHISEARTHRISDRTQTHSSSTNWLLQLYTELENQGINIPERLNEDELHRFHTAANGDFSCLVSSVKKTIRWRENYRILSGQELEMWSNMVFWHGFDMDNRPCLFVRLGRACISLPPSDRPRFAQAIVSQVEHGILHIVDSKNPQITVLVDCEGLSLRFPMQLVRSCSALLQDNFPNRLGCLIVIRLPPVVRVLAQTFIQVLKPVTRQKLKIEGPMFRKVLTEYLQALPSYLDGACTCSRCASLSICSMQPRINDDMAHNETNVHVSRTEDLPSLHINDGTDEIGCYDQALRSAVVGILILWVMIALIAGIYDPESHPTSSS